MNKLDKDYCNLLQDIIDNGISKSDRTGTGTISVFGRQIRHDMKTGFPLITTKKMAFKTMVTELLWFLRGDTNIKYLVDNNCHIWDGDCYQAYLKSRNKTQQEYKEKWGDEISNNPLTQEEFINKIKTDDEFAKKWGSLGKIYGFQWRSWGEWSTIDVPKKVLKPGIDQIANLIHDLKTNPDSRRLLVSAWNPSDLPHQVLPPCHYGFQVYTRELSPQERKNIYDKSSYTKDIFPTDENGWNSLFNDCNIPTRAISLMFNMRSTDVGLGLGFNLASYGLLLMMIAKQVNMVPDELVYNGGDVHLYLNHIEPIKEQLTREPYPLPTVKISDRVVNDISEYTLDDFKLDGYESHPPIKMPLSN